MEELAGTVLGVLEVMSEWMDVDIQAPFTHSGINETVTNSDLAVCT